MDGKLPPGSDVPFVGRETGDYDESESPDTVASPAREDTSEFTHAGIAPEARADRVPPEVDQDAPPVDTNPSGLPPVSEPAARRTAVPGIGGGSVPPREYGYSPKVRLSRPLADRERMPRVGAAPLPPRETGGEDEE